MRKLHEITNEKIGTLETQYRVKGDKNLEPFVGISKPRETDAEKPKKRADTVSEIMAETLEIVTPEVTVDDEMKDIIRLNLKMAPCSDSPAPAGSWLRAVSQQAIEMDDWSVQSAINQLRDTLLDVIPHLKESAYYMDRLFGGDNQRFVTSLKNNISPPDMGDESKMILELTAKAIRRDIIIYVRDEAQGVIPVKLETGPEANGKQSVNVLFHNGRFWSLHPYGPDEELQEAMGMEEKSQSERGKYKKKKGPTLTTKTKPGTKAKKDEKRRREEKSKTEAEIKMEAMEHLIDSLKADAGELRDKIRDMDNRESNMNKYIHSLEVRFNDLCPRCKEKTPDTAFTAAERYSIQRIAQIVEKLEANQVKYEKNETPETNPKQMAKPL